MQNVLNKIFIIVFLALPVIVFSQAPKFQLFPECGYSFNFLNKDIYSGKPLNKSLQLGGGLRIKLGKKLSIGIEAQQNKFNVEQAITSTYSTITGQDPNALKSFNQSTVLNGLLGLYYNKSNKRRSNLFEVGLAGGLQQLQIGKSALAFHNPYQLGALDTVYKQGEAKKTSPIAQFSLANTIFIKKSIGIRIAIKLQYAPNLYEATYREIKQSNTNYSFEEFCKTKSITQTTYNPISIIPSIGIVIPIGIKHTQKIDNPKKDDNKKKRKINCFGLKWNNTTKQDKCLEDDKLKFTISMASGLTNIIRYEVYLAPVSDLSNKTLLFNLPYPSTTFNINSLVLEIGKEYMVIVKLVYSNENYNCTQLAGPVKRCNKPCLNKTNDLPTSNGSKEN
ncbi:MAG: hypothetical protein IPP81_19930 [Chitinophagaceae bacterium]|nr:hypothetical protein [Chitinophagaceae bacterium]